MAFEFRLRALQKVKTFHRDEEKQNLAELLNVQQTNDAELENLERRRGELRKRHAEHLNSADLNTEILLQFNQCEAQIQKQIAELQSFQQEIQKKIEAQRNQVLDSEQEVKKLEKLEEKQRELYKKTRPSEN